jgi:hypothetical protein
MIVLKIFTFSHLSLSPLLLGYSALGLKKRKFSFSHFCENFRENYFRNLGKNCLQKYTKMTKILAKILQFIKVDCTLNFLQK